MKKTLIHLKKNWTVYLGILCIWGGIIGWAADSKLWFLVAIGVLMAIWIGSLTLKKK